MKYTDIDLCVMIDCFICLPAEPFRTYVKDFPGNDKADSILAYVYMHHIGGIQLALLACALRKEDRYSFFEGSDDLVSISVREAEECTVSVISEDKTLRKRFAEKLDKIDKGMNEDVKVTRNMAFLDRCRDRYNFDVLTVFLERDDRETEACPVRIEAAADHYFIGTLTEEPKQNFGYHKDDRIPFHLREEEDRVVCVCDMNAIRKMTKEDLADGTILKKAMHDFNDNRTEETLIHLLEILHDSDIIIPCTAVFSERDQEQFAKLLEENDDPVGKTIQSLDQVRLIPDILQSGDSYFFPVFTDDEAPGEYGKDFSLLPDTFLHALTLAENNEKNVTGIVINAFTDSFVVSRELFDAVRKMKSIIE